MPLNPRDRKEKEQDLFKQSGQQTIKHGVYNMSKKDLAEAEMRSLTKMRPL